ncbi:MAG: rhodanese-like domain-containing protein [Syntrophobacteraceae bacterium]
MSTVALQSETLNFADVLREMDIEFLVAGEYGITVEDAAKLVNKDHFLFLDVRTKEERAHLTFPFAMHIPINELPDRIGELPRDKFIITFCLTGFRGAMAYAYLRTQGFDEVKALKGRLDNLAGAMTPGRFYRLEP